MTLPAPHLQGPDLRWLVAETEHWNLYLNLDQGLLGRCFLMLRRAETDVTALAEPELLSLWEMTGRVKRALERQWEPDHYNYMFLMNQTPQVHFHIVPRYRGRREFAGGTFVDPEFGKHYGVGPARLLDEVAYTAIRDALEARL